MSSRSDHSGTFEKKVRELCEGFRRGFPASDQPVIFGGRKTTIAEVAAVLEKMEATFVAVHDAEFGFRQAVADRRRSVKAHRSTYGDAVVFLKHHLGRESPSLVDFGIRPPRAPKPLSVEARALARAKAAATRRARGVGAGGHEPPPMAIPPAVPPSGTGGCPSTAGAETEGESVPSPEDPEPNGAE